MKKFQQITSLVAGSALVLTPFLAFAQEGTYDRPKPEDRPRIQFQNFFGTENRIQLKAEDRQDTSATSTRVKGEAKVDGALEARIDKLMKLEDRIADMSRLTAEQKAALTTVVNAQLSSLNALKLRMEGTATTTKEDRLELAKSNRVAALVAPQVAISAASNRALYAAAQMEAFAPKLQARLASSSAAGVDVAAAQTAYTEMLASIASAKVKAQAAASMTVNLQADNGDQAIFAANQKVLKEAREKLTEAQADLRDARKDIHTILLTLKVQVSS